MCILANVRGMTLVTVMMALALSSIVGLALMSQQVNHMKATRMNESRAEVVSIRRSLQLLMENRQACDLAFRDGGSKPPTFVPGMNSRTPVDSVRFSNGTEILGQNGAVKDYQVSNLQIQVLTPDLQTALPDFDLRNGVTVRNGRRHLARMVVQLRKNDKAMGAPELTVPVDMEIYTGQIGPLSGERIATCRAAANEVVIGGGGIDYEEVCNRMVGANWNEVTEKCVIDADSGSGGGQATIELYCTWAYSASVAPPGYAGTQDCTPPGCPTEFPHEISSGCHPTGGAGAGAGYRMGGLCKRLCYRSPAGDSP